MELRHMRYVLAVAEELHFGRAAKRLNISQPPLSQQIKQLEEELGVKIFHRTKRQVKLTEAGRLFVDEARRTLAQAEHTANVAIRAGQGEVGQLTIGTIFAVGRPFVEILRRFRERYPDVRLLVRSLNTFSQVQALRDGRIDVGFLVLPVDDPSLVVESIDREQLVVALPEGHRLSHKERFPLSALANEPYITFSRYVSPGYYDAIVAACRNQGFSLNYAHESDNVYVSLSLVAAGLGVTLLPPFVQTENTPGIVFRKLTGPAPHREVGIGYRRERSQGVEAFLGIVRQVAARKKGAPAG